MPKPDLHPALRALARAMRWVGQLWRGAQLRLAAMGPALTRMTPRFRAAAMRLRRLLPFYDIALDAAEGAILGFVVLVLVVWLSPQTVPGFLLGLPHWLLGLLFALGGAGIAGYRSWRRERDKSS